MRMRTTEPGNYSQTATNYSHTVTQPWDNSSSWSPLPHPTSALRLRPCNRPHRELVSPRALSQSPASRRWRRLAGDRAALAPPPPAADAPRPSGAPTPGQSPLLPGGRRRRPCAATCARSPQCRRPAALRARPQRRRARTACTLHAPRG
eukprot:740289-Prymnesium_polylepis.1